MKVFLLHYPALPFFICMAEGFCSGSDFCSRVFCHRIKQKKQDSGFQVQSAKCLSLLYIFLPLLPYLAIYLLYITSMLSLSSIKVPYMILTYLVLSLCPAPCLTLSFMPLLSIVKYVLTFPYNNLQSMLHNYTAFSQPSIF